MRWGGDTRGVMAAVAASSASRSSSSREGYLVRSNVARSLDLRAARSSVVNGTKKTSSSASTAGGTDALTWLSVSFSFSSSMKSSRWKAG